MVKNLEKHERFSKFQEKMLNYVSYPRGGRKLSYLDEWEDKESLDSYRVRGGIKDLTEKGPLKKRVTPRIVRRRTERAQFYGYWGHELDIVAETEINFSSSTHYHKATLVRWLKVYEVCLNNDWDIRDFSKWEKAAQKIAEEEGLVSIWEIISET